MDNQKLKQLKLFANQLRIDVIDQVHSAKAGHPGGSLSMCDTYAYLYNEVLNIDPKDPKKQDRDRVVLSKGHTCPALYAVLAEMGYFDRKLLKTFRSLDSILQGHPDMKNIPGVDMSSGSLGQGISCAVGMAIAAKFDNAKYKVYSILGDGELQEGQVWEASMLAAHRKLDNLVLIVDNNGLQIDGEIEKVNSPYPITDKFEAFGFRVLTADAHDFLSLKQAFDKAAEPCDKPTVIIQKSIKGKDVSFMENKASWHGTAPNDEQYEQAMTDLNNIKKSLEA